MYLYPCLNSYLYFDGPKSPSTPPPRDPCSTSSQRVHSPFQFHVRLINRLRNNPHIPQDRHEIDVPIPPRHDVRMNMPRHARARTLPNVEPNVKPLRIHGQ